MKYATGKRKNRENGGWSLKGIKESAKRGAKRVKG